MQPLTKRQQQILFLDQKGLGTKDIADLLHLSQPRVAKTKSRLRELGFTTAYSAHNASRMPDDGPGTGIVTRSVHEPEDDEMPDADEPITVVSRCQCGLQLPCHHEPIQILRSAWIESDFDDVSDVSEASIENGKRRASRKSKKEQLTGVDTAL